MSPPRSPALDLILNQFKGIGVNNGGVRVLDIILGDLTTVFPDGLGEKVYSIGFLEQGVTFILLILKNAHNCGNAPLLFSCRSRDTLAGQLVGNGANSVSLQE